MPTVLLINGYRIGFFSGDRTEPPHVHVSKSGNGAKFWLAPLRLAENDGFRRHELGGIHETLKQHQEKLLNEWNRYFGQNPGH